jgi:predicted DNA-binding transcriptional regulator AlpA
MKSDDDEVSRRLTTRQVAQRLNMTPAAIYQAAARGRLPCRVWNGRLLFLAAELDEFLRALPARAVTHEATGKKRTRDD